MSRLIAGRSLRGGSFLFVAVALGCGIQREGEGTDFVEGGAAGSGGFGASSGHGAGGTGGTGVAGVFGLGGSGNVGGMSGSQGGGEAAGSAGSGGSGGGGGGVGGNAGGSGGPLDAGARDGGDASNDAMAKDASVTDAINDVVADIGRDASSDAEASVADAKPDVCVSSNEICDGLDNNCNGTVDDQNTCPGGCNGFTYQGKGYMFCHAQARQASWPDAQADCVSRGMHLVRVDSAAENQWIVDTMVGTGSNGAIWIGANDRQTDGIWVWTDSVQFWQGAGGGGPVGGLYNRWATGQPNNNAVGGEACAELSTNGAWNDLGCDDFTRAYVCEK